MEDRNLINLILSRFEMLGSCGHCGYIGSGDCLAKSCTGCRDKIIDFSDYEVVMADIHKMIEEKN